METLAKQLEVSKAETVAAITERETLKIENEKLGAAITELRNTISADIHKLQGEVKAEQEKVAQAQERIAQAEKLASTRASEIAAAAGHPPIASAPAASSKAATVEELWTEYRTIKNPMDKAKFYQSHKELWLK